MRFYGIPSEDRALELLESVPEGLWVFSDGSHQTQLNSEETKAKLRDVILMVKSWKERERYIPKSTAFIFIHTPSEPRHFKVYDLSSLGCSNSLSPPRWECYLLESR